MKFLRLNLIAVCLLAFVALPISANMGVELMTEYFDLLSSGNFESASYLWQKPSRDRAQRFGITYENISLKMDCNSPLVRNLNYLSSALYSPYTRVEGLGKGYVRVHFSGKVGTDSVIATYYTVNDGKYLWMVYPQDYYARTWETQETQFLRIHVHPDRSKDLNPVALEAADQYIRNMGDSLQLSPTDMTLLQAQKIDYYYCDSSSTVNDIIGSDTEGSFDMASDDIISARFPHYHELVHFLVAFKLRVLPLYTLPIMREGVAVMYGGRWGKAPATLYGLGAFLYTNKLVDMDSLITMDGFAALSGADVNYPVAGIFSAFLKQKLGLDGYFKVYRAMSTDYDSLHAMTADMLKARLATAAAFANWSELSTAFETYLAAYTTTYSDIVPGETTGNQVLKKGNLEVRESKDWITIIANADSAGATTGTLLFGKDQRLNELKSDLFELQFKGSVPYEGYRYAIRWDTNEAGLYDYATNQINAKYILGITPDSTYYKESAKRVAIHFRKSLFNNVTPVEKDARILNQ